jgi:hypothetical protein
VGKQESGGGGDQRNGNGKQDGGGQGQQDQARHGGGSQGHGQGQGQGESQGQGQGESHGQGQGNGRSQSRGRGDAGGNGGNGDRPRTEPPGPHDSRAGTRPRTHTRSPGHIQTDGRRRSPLHGQDLVAGRALARTPAGSHRGPAPLFLRSTRSRPPMLVPLDQLASEQALRGGSDTTHAPAQDATPAPARRSASAERLPLPFTGLSVLTLILAGIAAMSAGRRLHAATAIEPPREIHPEPIARALARTPPQPPAARPPSPPTRRAAYVGLALLAVTALALTRGSTARA